VSIAFVKGEREMTGAVTGEEMRLFWEEAVELLDVLEAEALRALNGEDRADVDAAFRAMHTLKGMGAMVGLAHWAEAAHRLESRLDQVRQGLEPLSHVAPDILEAVDRFRSDRPGQDAGLSPPDHEVPLLVTLAPDTAFPGVRVFQVVNAARGHVAVVGVSPPEEAWEHFQGRDITLTVRGDEAAIGRVMAELRQAEDVLDVRRAVPEPSGPDVRPVKTGGKAVQDTVRVQVDVLDQLLEGIGELVLDRTQTDHLMKQWAPSDDIRLAYETISEHMTRTTLGLQDLLMRARMLPLDILFRQYPRVVHDLAAKLGKSIRISIVGEDTELDRVVMDSIGEPLLHLIRNACDHGIESPAERERAGKSPEGLITVRAATVEGHVVIQVADDGAGIDWDRLRVKAVERGWWDEATAQAATTADLTSLLFRPGVSTAQTVTDVSGRGVGLDVVDTVMNQLHGSVAVTSQPGRGTQFELILPLTIAIMRALLVKVGRTPFAIPLSSIERVEFYGQAGIRTLLGQPVVTDAQQTARPVLDLRRWWMGEEAPPEYLVRIRDGPVSAALAVSDIVGDEEVVVKTLGLFSALTPQFSGATILGDGQLALVLDIRRVMQQWQRQHLHTN
jgi:two-component system chemotaxis sensor kinase CheA